MKAHMIRKMSEVIQKLQKQSFKGNFEMSEKDLEEVEL